MTAVVYHSGRSSRDANGNVVWVQQSTSPQALLPCCLTHLSDLLRALCPEWKVVLVWANEVMVEGIVATLFLEHQTLQSKQLLLWWTAPWVGCCDQAQPQLAPGPAVDALTARKTPMTQEQDTRVT